jgi:hypothetical protein
MRLSHRPLGTFPDCVVSDFSVKNNLPNVPPRDSSRAQIRLHGGNVDFRSRRAPIRRRGAVGNAKVALVRNIAIAGWLRWNQIEMTLRSDARRAILDFGRERIPQCGYRYDA